MPKKIKFPQKETEIADVEVGFDVNLVDEKYDGVFMAMTMKDGRVKTLRHQKLCPWD